MQEQQQPQLPEMQQPQIQQPQLPQQSQQKQPPWVLIIWLTFIVSVLGVGAIDLLSGGVLIAEIAKLILAAKSVGK